MEVNMPEETCEVFRQLHRHALVARAALESTDTTHEQFLCAFVAPPSTQATTKSKSCENLLRSPAFNSVLMCDISTCRDEPNTKSFENLSSSREDLSYKPTPGFRSAYRPHHEGGGDAGHSREEPAGGSFPEGDREYLRASRVCLSSPNIDVQL